MSLITFYTLKVSIKEQYGDSALLQPNKCSTSDSTYRQQKIKKRPLYQDFYSNEKIMCANHILMTLELQDMLHDKLYLQRHAVQKEELISQVKIEYKWY